MLRNKVARSARPATVGRLVVGQSWTILRSVGLLPGSSDILRLLIIPPP
jgi:hypothetical protein